MEFSYQARDKAGLMRTGTVEAVNEVNAFDILQEHGFIVVKIQPASQINFSQIVIFDRVSLKDLVLFSRQLATLINAKVPIVQALKIMEKQVTSHKFKNILQEVSARVENGDSLSSAISAFPKVFSNLYVNLIRSGELSGGLDESLSYLANQLERDYDLRSKVIGALTYPIFIVFALVIVGVMMFIYVLPPLVAILQESEVELPFTTKILIFSTSFMQNFWWLALMLVVGGAAFFTYYSKTTTGRYVIDYAKIKMPIFGKLYKSIYMSRYARNLATLIAGGIPIVKALESVSEIVGNKLYKDIIIEASQQVRNGKTIAASLVNHPEMPLIVVQMTEIGESTGKLHEIMDKLANFYEKEVEGLLRVLTTLIEPLIMILLGAAVAIMVAGILLPIYNLASTA